MKFRTVCLFLIPQLLVLAGCGGGGGGEDDQLVQQQLTLNVVRAESGWLSQNGFASPDTDTFVGTIPDITGFLETRGVLVFDLSSIPAGATVVSAELRSLQGAPTGTPYAQVVQIITDHLNGNTGPIASTDFNATALSTIANPPLSNDDTEEVKTLDVTAQLENDVAQNRSNSKFRLRGQAINPATAGNADTVDPVDLARFLTGTGETQLVIVIEVPAPNP